MRQTGRQLTESAQFVTLLFGPAILANPIGQYPNEPRKKFRDLLEHFRKALLLQAQKPGVCRGARGEGELRHAGEWQHADHLAGTTDESNCVGSASLAPSPNFALKQYKQGIRGVALVQQYVARVQHDFLRA